MAQDCVWSRTVTFVGTLLLCALLSRPTEAASEETMESVPDKTVVLTFDDGVVSHLDFVAPLLKELGFGATFFVSTLWVKEDEHFLSWEQVAELHEMGFEVGNHSWTHSDFGEPAKAAHLAGELALVERELAKVGVPKPVSFAWTGNGFSPEGMRALKSQGYLFARRGMQPEVAYGKLVPGPLYNPSSHHPLLIPSAGDAYPEWELEHFRNAVDRARDGEVAVVQFHGVPDIAHEWVSTPQDRFREYMDYLAENGFNVLAMRDLAKYVEPTDPPMDPMTFVRYPVTYMPLQLPPEVTASRADQDYWLWNALHGHGFSTSEAGAVFDYPGWFMERTLELWQPPAELDRLTEGTSHPALLPYPGGKHPRNGWREHAIDPMRGTKVSLFAPWEDGGYVVLDLPEALWRKDGLIFLAHRDIPTVWDHQMHTFENIDWQRLAGGALARQRRLPDGLTFGAKVNQTARGAAFRLWLENGTEETVAGIRAQVCMMLSALKGFEVNEEATRMNETTVAIHAKGDASRWVLLRFEADAARVWTNPPVPCMHVDPELETLEPGAKTSVAGRAWFYEGDNIKAEMAAGI